jgi:hypothetical protein
VEVTAGAAEKRSFSAGEPRLIFHNPVPKRARHAAKRHSPGEAGVGRAKLAAGRGTWKIFTA